MTEAIATESRHTGRALRSDAPTSAVLMIAAYFGLVGWSLMDGTDVPMDSLAVMLDGAIFD